MKFKILILPIVATIFLSNFSFAQELKKEKIILTGNLSADSKIILKNINLEKLPEQKIIQNNDKKSPFLSGLLSAVLPGAGQFYNGDYWKTGIFLAVEAAVITTAVIYDKKGDDKTTQFQNYADAPGGWSVVKYAQWLNQHYYSDPTDPTKKPIYINPDVSLPPWKRVNFKELNAKEVGSHQLREHGDQQYYELIGKYHEYSPGWTEFDPNNANVDDIPAQFHYYSGLRGKANDFYGTASTAVIGIYVNHILSAIEAIWSTAKYNKNLVVNFRLENERLVDRLELIPTLKLKYKF